MTPDRSSPPKDFAQSDKWTIIRECVVVEILCFERTFKFIKTFRRFEKMEHNQKMVFDHIVWLESVNLDFRFPEWYLDLSSSMRNSLSSKIDVRSCRSRFPRTKQLRLSRSTFGTLKMGYLSAFGSKERTFQDWANSDFWLMNFGDLACS